MIDRKNSIHISKSVGTSSEDPFMSEGVTLWSPLLPRGDPINKETGRARRNGREIENFYCAQLNKLWAMGNVNELIS